MHPVPSQNDAPPIRVGIIEDDAVLRECFGQMVDEVDGFTLCGSAATLADGLALLDDEPDVLLVDLQLPDGSGLDVIAKVRATGHRAKVLVITVFADVRSVVGAIEEGADGYLLKEADVDQIAAAIRTVLDGGAPISPAVASHILARVRRDGAVDGPRRAINPSPTMAAVSLTAKETQVLEALASGRSFKEVAAQQGISLHTVGDHVKAIYRKLSVNSRGEAVFKAVQSGLIRMEQE
jgi:DNA-binding NarL/FixJ family response regulator